MRKMTNKKRMWRQIAREFEQYANGAPRNEITKDGLCWATEVLGGTWADFPTFFVPYDGGGIIDYRPRDEFSDPLSGQHKFGYYWPFGRRGAARRAIFAQLMAEVSE